MINDVQTSYMLDAIPYAGRVTEANNQPIPAYYIKDLGKPIKNTNRNITVDNWFSSIPLFEDMLVNHGLVGTMRRNTREIPASFFGKKPEGSNLFMFNENKMHVFYSLSKNNVIMLSTSMYYSTDTDESGKPEVILFYSTTNGGTDTCNKLCHSYTVSISTNR